MNYEQYRAHPALSKSNLVYMLRSMAHFEHALAHPMEQTPQMKLGSAIHMAVLQHGLFKETYVVSPKFDRRTTVGKADALKFEERNKDKQWLTEDQMQLVQDVREAIIKHPTASALINGMNAIIERPYFGTIDGVSVKGLPDLVIDHVVDLKTTENASAKEFGRSIIKYRYDMQAAMYCHLTGKKEFLIIAVESSPPHNIAVYRLSETDIAIGMDDLRRAISIYKAYSAKPANARWNGYPIGITSLELWR